LTTADSLIRGLPPRRAATMLVCSVYMDFAGAVESTLSCLLPTWSVALAAYRVLASLSRAAWPRPGGWEAYWASDGSGEAYWASKFCNSGKAYWTRMLSVSSTTVRASVRRRGPSLLLLALMACCARRRHILIALDAAPASAAVGLGASSLITVAATCTQVLGSVVLLGGIILALCPRKSAIKFCLATAVLIPACAALSPDSMPRPAPVPACSTLSPVGSSHALLPDVSVPTHSGKALPCIPCVPFAPPRPFASWRHRGQIGRLLRSARHSVHPSGLTGQCLHVHQRGRPSGRHFTTGSLPSRRRRLRRPRHCGRGHALLPRGPVLRTRLHVRPT
jgi:hypothetical protein